MTPTATGTELREIQDWYAGQCDGDWEHTYGVRIATLDTFEDAGEPGAQDWWICQVRDAQFRGSGGPAMLEVLLRVFLTLAHK